MFAKLLCHKCTLNNDCCCQKESFHSVDNCGMEKVLGYNKEYNLQLQTGRLERDPDTGNFNN